MQVNLTPHTLDEIASDIQERLRMLHYRHSDKPFHHPGTQHIRDSILQTLGLADAEQQSSLLRWFPIDTKGLCDESSINVSPQESSGHSSNSNDRTEGRDR